MTRLFLYLVIFCLSLGWAFYAIYMGETQAALMFGAAAWAGIRLFVDEVRA